MDKLVTISSYLLLALSLCSVAVVFVRVQAVSVATNRLRIVPVESVESEQLDTATAAAAVATATATAASATSSTSTTDEEDDLWELEDAETLRIRLIRSLGLSKMPDLSQKVSITTEVMDKAYEIYWKNVAETERRNQQLMAESSRVTPSQYEQEENLNFVVTYNDQGSSHVPPEAFTSLQLNGNLSVSWLYFPVRNHTFETDYSGSGGDRVSPTIKATLSLRVTRPVDLSVYKVTWDGRVVLLEKSGSAPRYEWNLSDVVRTWLQPSQSLNRGLIVRCTKHCDSLEQWSMPKGTDAILRVSRGLATPSISGPRELSEGGGGGGGGRRRTKRSTPHDLLKEPTFTGKTDCTKGIRHSYCCRKNLTVSAEQLGLTDIIIEPKKFNFYYCRGKCPHKYNPASTHAILQSLIYRTYKKGGKVCCAPSKLGDLEVLHLDESSKKPVHSQWKNAVVLECACS